MGEREEREEEREGRGTSGLWYSEDFFGDKGTLGIDDRRGKGDFIRYAQRWSV